MLSTGFCYARDAENMKEITGFGMKKSSRLPSSANKYFESLRDENDEPIYTYNEEFNETFCEEIYTRRSQFRLKPIL